MGPRRVYERDPGRAFVETVRAEGPVGRVRVPLAVEVDGAVAGIVGRSGPRGSVSVTSSSKPSRTNGAATKRAKVVVQSDAVQPNGGVLRGESPAYCRRKPS